MGTATPVEPLQLPPTRVLVVEHLARRRSGHYMARLKDIAEALIADGHEVHVLTAFGLAIEQEGGTIDGLAGTHLPARRWGFLHRVGLRLWPTISTTEPTKIWQTPRRVIGVTCMQIATVRGIASCVRSIGGDPPVAVVVLSPRVHYGWAAVLAPLDARWTIHCHRFPSRNTRTGSKVAPIGQRLSSRWEHKRRARGGRVDFIAGNSTVASEWHRRHPELHPEVIHLSGMVDVEPAPRAEARRALGLDEPATVALQFGGAHEGKDLATIFLAFAGEDVPIRLVSAGHGVDKSFERVRRAHPDVDFPNVTVLGRAQSDSEKHLLHSAADFAVLSYVPDWRSDSGVLTDAVAYDLPVCCSDQSVAGALVAEYGLGSTFPSGDVDALRKLLPVVASMRPDADHVARFRHDYSMTAIARRMLLSATGSKIRPIESSAVPRG